MALAMRIDPSLCLDLEVYVFSYAVMYGYLTSEEMLTVCRQCIINAEAEERALIAEIYTDSFLEEALFDAPERARQERARIAEIYTDSFLEEALFDAPERARQERARLAEIDTKS
jgi:hypothetical protein